MIREITVVAVAGAVGLGVSGVESVRKQSMTIGSAAAAAEAAMLAWPYEYCHGCCRSSAE